METRSRMGMGMGMRIALASIAGLTLLLSAARTASAADETAELDDAGGVEGYNPTVPARREICDNFQKKDYRDKHHVTVIDDYRAEDDPAGNDAPALQRMADAVAKSAIPGIVVFPAGEYGFSSVGKQSEIRFERARGFRLVGCGDARIRVLPQNKSFWVFHFLDSDHFTVENLSFVGVRRSGSAIQTSACHHYRLSGVRARNFTVGLYLGWGTAQWMTYRNWFQDYDARITDFHADGMDYMGALVGTANFPPSDPRRRKKGGTAMVFDGIHIHDVGGAQWSHGIGLESKGNTFKMKDGKKVTSYAVTDHITFNGCDISGVDSGQNIVITMACDRNPSHGVVDEHVYFSGGCRIDPDDDQRSSFLVFGCPGLRKGRSPFPWTN